MGTVLISMPRSEDAVRIGQIVQGGGLMMDTEICQTGSEILRIANDRDFGVVICTKRLKDMSYSEIAEYLPSSFGIIILTSDSTIETFSDRMVKVQLPFKRSGILSTIEMLTESFTRRPRRKKQNPPRVRTEEEKRIIDNAKLILMNRNGMSEPEAFRYIQKTSMDTGRTTVETAEMIFLMNNA